MVWYIQFFDDGFNRSIILKKKLDSPFVHDSNALSKPYYLNAQRLNYSEYKIHIKRKNTNP